jgi:hypothetical protein
MKANFTRWTTCLIGLGLACCSPQPQSGNPTAEAKQPRTSAPVLVGRIASVPAGKRFVLIQSYGKWAVEAGTILTTRGEEERVANLLVTGEVLGEFAAADLQSGLVAVGDGVYLRHVPKPVEVPAEDPAAEKPAPASLPDL